MSSFWRMVCCVALLCLALLAVASAISLEAENEDFMDEQQPFDELEEAQTEKRSGLDWNQFLRYQRAAHWSRKYGFASSLDNSVHRYENRMKTCSVGDVCKSSSRRSFKCRCNSYTFCRATSKNSDATCEYSAVGVVFNQPN